MELDRKEMGRRISKRRKVLGIKQAVLAEKIGVNGNHLSSVETGKVTPSLELFVKICDELGVTPDYLLEGAMHSNISIPLLRSGGGYRIDLQKMRFYLNMMGTQIL